ncbi:MAG: hypothetical protein LBS74_08730, partial [Oscillospiraceae bacterium]|nr:hypothetical protein [Oscillospiraceae bacterium]
TTTVAKSKVTTAIKEKSASQIIAGLINEDGTGEIQINMKREQVMEILKNHNVSSKVVGKEWLEIEDGSKYALGTFEIKQTQKGLKVGDSVSKVYELYSGGEAAYRYDESNDEAYFVFKWETKLAVSGTMYNSVLVVALTKDQQKVSSIGIGLDMG